MTYSIEDNGPPPTTKLISLAAAVVVGLLGFTVWMLVGNPWVERATEPGMLVMHSCFAFCVAEIVQQFFLIGRWRKERGKIDAQALRPEAERESTDDESSDWGTRAALACVSLAGEKFGTLEYRFTEYAVNEYHTFALRVLKNRFRTYHLLAYAMAMVGILWFGWEARQVLEVGVGTLTDAAILLGLVYGSLTFIAVHVTWLRAYGVLESWRADAMKFISDRWGDPEIPVTQSIRMPPIGLSASNDSASETKPKKDSDEDDEDDLLKQLENISSSPKEARPAETTDPLLHASTRASNSEVTLTDDHFMAGDDDGDGGEDDGSKNVLI